jgi:hypothetical protein
MSDIDAIKSLRRQLEVTQLEYKEYREMALESDNELRQQLSECQAREKVLRDELQMVAYDEEGFCMNPDAAEALAMPYDSTALDEAIKQAKREALLEAASRFDGSLPFNWVCADGYSNGFDIAGELNYMAEELK